MRFHPNDLATSQDKLVQYKEETKTLCQNIPEPNGVVLFFYLKLEYKVDAASLGQDVDKDPGCVVDKPDPYNKGVYMHSGETPKRETRRPASSYLSLWRTAISARGAKHVLSHLVVTQRVLRYGAQVAVRSLRRGRQNALRARLDTLDRPDRAELGD
ncbi:hypothetical protein PG996_008235 [Apiospora saccharicola]|uniref:Uncharacterized protein n=1 Tax=Apiospora saccharicola TaxID=335842 RepID=A0ABR1UXC2_9PEZI